MPPALAPAPIILQSVLLAQAAAAADTAASALPGALAAASTPAATFGVYVSLAAGPILTEELAPLVAGAAASQGELALWPAIAVMTLGGWTATTLLYALGRWRGRWIARRFPRAEATVERLLGAVERRPWQSALAVRYAVGARVLLPLACGAAHVRPSVYLPATLVSSVTWSLLFGLLGFWFGDAAIRALRHVEAYDQYAVAVLAGLAVVGYFIVRRRRAARAALAAAAPVDPPVASRTPR